jgi:NADH-quinone oxidoreductase subunit C
MSEEGVNSQYLCAKLGQDILELTNEHGHDTMIITRDKLLATVLFLREDPRLNLDFLTDITAVDYLGRKEPRFEVVYHFYSLRTKFRLRVKVPVPEEDPVVDSLTPLWKAANWLEREVWDMYGIRFGGHPDLRRILLYEEFQGHPLRKDYPVNQCQPLVPLREIEGTFVDQRSETKLLRLRHQLSTKV